MASPTLPTKLRPLLTGEMPEVFPVLRVSLKDDLFDMVTQIIAREIERSLKHSAGTVMHGARIAGELEDIGVGERGTWIAVGGEKGDGRNCEDCLDLHGQEMAREQYEDIKYTTACDGNCRCHFVPLAAVDDARQIESIATSEFMGEQP